jgi:hypothetical protein
LFELHAPFRKNVNSFASSLAIQAGNTFGVVLSGCRFRESVAQPGKLPTRQLNILDAARLSGFQTQHWMTYSVQKNRYHHQNRTQAGPIKIEMG